MTPTHTRPITAALLAVAAAAFCAAPSRVAAQAAAAPPTAGTLRPQTAAERAHADSLKYPYTAADVRFMSAMIHHHSQAIVMGRMAPTHGARASVQTLAERIIAAQQDEIATMQRWLADRGQPVPAVEDGPMKMDAAMAMDAAMKMDAPTKAGGAAQTTATRPKAPTKSNATKPNAPMSMAGMSHDTAGHAAMDHAAMDHGAMNHDAMGHAAAGEGMLMPGMLTPAQMAQLDAARGPDFDRLFLTFMIQHHRGATSMVRDLFSTYGAAQDETVFKFASDVNVDQTTEIARMQRMLVAVTFQPQQP